ncbi:transcriptional regulator [Nocardia cyriacigeorgica]|uniref:transcriptional regulator n=1 Tax=Nocardia cyriacigeorgica TaxID=135487 RepID=UPI00245865DE|nr:transcriptional regulator [Nocardia cyriacigeorgica]
MAAHSTLAEQRAALEKEWSRWVPDGSHPALPRVAASGLRSEVAQSWMRSVRTVDPATASAPAVDSADIGTRWEQSPLREPVTQLADQLHNVAHDAGYVAAVTDETGTILWSFGGPVMRRCAEQVNFAPGGRWDEQHMGTNALSLAMQTGKPSTVFSAEHLVAALHGWVCYCAPIHAPDGRRLGVLDLSSTWDRSHPLAMSTVQSLVTAVEARLHAATAVRPGVRLTCLGGARLMRDGHPVRLRPRQLEILTLLALEPDGFTPERLHYAIYGDRPATSSTLKADVSHLRRATGGEIANRVYQLTTPLSCDAVDLLGALEAGDTGTAVRMYRGPLLPGSQTPGIVEWRDHLEVAVRTAVLSDEDPDNALRYGERAPDDIEIHEHALRLLPPNDGRRAVAAARLHTALRS